MFNQLSPGGFFFVCLCNFVVFPSSAAYSGNVCSTRSSFTESTINSSPSRHPGQTPKQPQLARYQTAACLYPMAKLLTPSEGETGRCPHTHPWSSHPVGLQTDQEAESIDLTLGSFSPGRTVWLFVSHSTHEQDVNMNFLQTGSARSFLFHRRTTTLDLGLILIDVSISDDLCVHFYSSFCLVSVCLSHRRLFSLWSSLSCMRRTTDWDVIDDNNEETQRTSQDNVFIGLLFDMLLLYYGVILAH